ncbi:hypothetical protein B0H16DRAFT_1788953 [Mycena metata]|uniref:Uncharacterized protein n=1 Tax=Mycena metata TaxID=1033252 RepID=A0AAD7MLS1_9AGAR|nr:hypothetical protein B0H16DRAFT_1788953 [Mycena metata]
MHNINFPQVLAPTCPSTACASTITRLNPHRTARGARSSLVAGEGTRSRPIASSARMKGICRTSSPVGGETRARTSFGRRSVSVRTKMDSAIAPSPHLRALPAHSLTPDPQTRDFTREGTRSRRLALFAHTNICDDRSASELRGTISIHFVPPKLLRRFKIPPLRSSYAAALQAEHGATQDFVRSAAHFRVVQSFEGYSGDGRARRSEEYYRVRSTPALERGMQLLHDQATHGGKFVFTLFLLETAARVLKQKVGGGIAADDGSRSPPMGFLQHHPNAHHDHSHELRDAARPSKTPARGKAEMNAASVKTLAAKLREDVSGVAERMEGVVITSTISASSLLNTSPSVPSCPGLYTTDFARRIERLGKRIIRVSTTDVLIAEAAQGSAAMDAPSFG